MEKEDKRVDKILEVLSEQFEKSGFKKPSPVSNQRDYIDQIAAGINILSENLNNELKAKDQLIDSVNKELELFSYIVAHDLRSPLRAVNGYAEILEEEHGSKLNKEGKHFLKLIKYYSDKMGSLIEELLEFSRLGRKEINKEEIDLNEITKGVVRDLNKSIVHKAKIKIGKLHKVQGDYGLLSQVMNNLISNAIKFSSKKDKPLIEINSLEKKGKVIISVKDNGAGFNMQYMDKLFGVFQRLHLQEDFEGSGMGLAVVKRIINKHGGLVWAEGKVNEGAVFYFSLAKN